MSPQTSHILTLNGGSSSIKFALYQAGEQPVKTLAGKVERIGFGDARLDFHDSRDGRHGSQPLAGADHASVAQALMNWLEAQLGSEQLSAAGHRVVHGMAHAGPERITPALLDELRQSAPFAPEHLPREIELIEVVAKGHPHLPQVACFDTAFHQAMPRVAQLLPLPRDLDAKGVRRYGFHGLSYAFLLEELARLGDPAATHGRVILAHLGNGASMAAVKDGQSVDTSMGFTPASGLVMGTRAGDLDPGLVSFLAQTQGLTPAQFGDMANRRSGLLGISETSSDMRDLLAREPADVRAAEAVALFCQQAKKCIGSFAAVLGGLDTLVFSGGIGENAAPVRTRICENLRFLGIEVDELTNAAHAPVISKAGSPVTVRVMRTDEEAMIARATSRLLHLNP